MNTAIIEKIQKLLALSKGNNMNEAMVATAIANKLIDEHRLSEAELSTDFDPMIQDDESLYVTGRVIPWKNSLACQLAKHYGCVIINVLNPRSKSKRKVSNYKLVGKKSDVEVTKYMFSWLLGKCQQLSNENAKGKGHIYVSSYCMGFVSGVMSQLSTSRLQAQDGASSAAIVAINSRVEESMAFLRKNKSNLKEGKSNSSARFDGEAYSKFASWF